MLLFSQSVKWVVSSCLLQSCSDSALCPEMEADTHSWESFLSTVREEVESTKVSHPTNIIVVVWMLRRLPLYFKHSFS